MKVWLAEMSNITAKIIVRTKFSYTMAIGQWNAKPFCTTHSICCSHNKANLLLKKLWLIFLILRNQCLSYRLNIIGCIAYPLMYEPHVKSKNCNWWSGYLVPLRVVNNALRLSKAVSVDPLTIMNSQLIKVIQRFVDCFAVRFNRIELNE